MNKKLVSLICAFTMLFTLMSFVSVSAEVGTPSFELVYDAESMKDSNYAILSGYYKNLTGLGISKQGIPPKDAGNGLCDMELHIPIDCDALGIDPTGVSVSDTGALDSSLKGPFGASFKQISGNKYEIVVAGTKTSISDYIKDADSFLFECWLPLPKADAVYTIAPSELTMSVAVVSGGIKTSSIDFSLANIDTTKGTVVFGANDDDDDEEEITVKNEVVTGYTGEKTLIYVAKVLQKADANKKVVLTKNGEAQNSYRSLAEILGGVAAPGGTLSGDVAIGVLTNDTTATFGFELVD